MFFQFVLGVVFAQTVRFETNVGDIDIELYTEDAPITVQNFLDYVNRGDYDDTVIHRHHRGFVLQGGGFRYQGEGTFTTVPTDPPIQLEVNRSNTVGTIAMARNSNQDSATNQWFINLVDNTFLDTENGGFAAFGEIVRGMEVVEIIKLMQVVNFQNSSLGTAITQFPTYGFAGRLFSDTNFTNYVLDFTDMGTENVIKINRAYVLSDVFQINAGLSGAWFNPITNGQGIYIEVLPSAGIVIMAWFTFDTANPDEMVMNEVGYAGSRWLTSAGPFQGNQFSGPLFETVDGIFDDPVSVTNVEIGQVTITFNSCTEAIMTFSFTDSDLGNSTALQRISGSNVALCEELASAANPGITVN